MGTPHRIEQRPVFKFEELEDSAKEAARNWYRSASQDQWWEGVYESAAEVADMLGIEIHLRKGTPVIFFSGFCSQGDGARFEGSYAYKKGALKAVKADRPEDVELHALAKSLQDVQRRNFYKLTAECTSTGHYQHSGCMAVEVSYSDDMYRAVTDEDEVRQLLREFADWIYQKLENEHDWLNSDAQVEESIEANQYEFYENGDIA